MFFANTEQKYLNLEMKVNVLEHIYAMVRMLSFKNVDILHRRHPHKCYTLRP